MNTGVALMLAMLFSASMFALYVVISSPKKERKDDPQIKFPFDKKLTSSKH